MIDVDGDGKVSYGEAKQVLFVDAKAFKKIFKMFDINGVRY